MRRLEWIGLGCIVAIAFVLRCINLNTGLWYDEIVTLVNYVRLPTQELFMTYTSTNNHILYSLTAQGTVGLFGESAWALRLPAVLFGVASIAALWWLATHVVSRSEAMLAALMLTCSYHHIAFSQNARGYTGLLLCALVATTLFLKGLKGRSWMPWIAYGVVLAAAMYMHLSAGFIFATHGLLYLGWLLWRRARSHQQDQPQTEGAQALNWWLPMSGFVSGGLLMLLLYAPLVPQMIDSLADTAGSKPYGGVSEWKNPLWTILETVNSFGEQGWVFTLGLAVGGTLALVGIIDLLRKQPLFALVPLIHVPFTFAILVATSFRIWPRYFFVDAGFAILFLIRGVFVVSQFVTDKLNLEERGYIKGKWVGIAATILFIIGSLFLLPRNYQLPKQDFVGARDFVESSRSPQEPVASLGLASVAFEKYYAPHWKTVKTPKELDQLRTRSEPMWLVYSFPKHTAAKYPDIVERVGLDFELVSTFRGTLGDGSVLVYRSRQN